MNKGCLISKNILEKEYLLELKPMLERYANKKEGVMTY